MRQYCIAQRIAFVDTEQSVYYTLYQSILALAMVSCRCHVPEILQAVLTHEYYYQSMD